MAAAVTDRWFDDADDAMAYLGEVGRVWLVWVVTLVGLLLFEQWWALLVIALLFLSAMAVLGRPLQDRANRVPGADEPTGSTMAAARGRGRRKDDAFRQLLYGEAPLREALRVTGAPLWLLWVRRILLVVTVVAFVWVMIGVFAG